jgi:hypothetical protein
MTIDGRLDESEWSRANVERHFVSPWTDGDAPQTEFLAFCDDEFLHFAFRVEKSDVVALDKLKDKQDIEGEDRVAIYLSRDHCLSEYYCLEIDSRGRVLDYRGSYYRQLDPTWHCEGLETAALVGTVGGGPGYTVEGRIALAALKEMNISPRYGTPLEQGGHIFCGLYRVDCPAVGDDAAVKDDATTARAYKLGEPRPGEQWITWVDPKTPKPDVHVPASLGYLEIAE